MSFITCVCCIFTTLTYAQWICSSDRWPCIADLNGIILYYYIRVLYILFVVEMLYYYYYMLYYITLRYPLNSSIYDQCIQQTVTSLPTIPTNVM